MFKESRGSQDVFRLRIPPTLVWSLLPCLLLLVVEISTYAVQIQFEPVPQSVVEQRLRAVGDKNSSREVELKELFKEAGCSETQLTEQVVERKRPPNLACILPGGSDATIVVGAHFDHVNVGRGVVDDWSGAALLPSLLASLKSSPRKHTFLFVGFTEEEKHLLGSTYYVKHLDHEQTSRIRAMVNLECLGLTATKVWADHADPRLLSALLNVARGMNLPIQGVNVERVGDDDADSFRHRHVPTITLHSVTQETWPILHSKRDDFPAINANAYYSSYRLITAYLVYLDSELD